jgi:hypothetical protein
MHTGDPSGETETVVVAKENLCKQLRELTIRLQKKEVSMCDAVLKPFFMSEILFPATCFSLGELALCYSPLKGLCSYALWPYSIHWIPQGSLHCYRVRELLFLVFPVVMQAEMKIFQSFDPVYLRLQYERKLEELEEEKQSLQVKFCMSFGKESLGWLHVTTVLSTTHFVSSIIVSLFSWTFPL